MSESLPPGAADERRATGSTRDPDADDAAAGAGRHDGTAAGIAAVVGAGREDGPAGGGRRRWRRPDRGVAVLAGVGVVLLLVAGGVGVRAVAGTGDRGEPPIAGTGRNIVLPSARTTSSPSPTGSPLRSGATTTCTLSPALIMFERQPTRCIMLMLVSSTL